MMDDKFRELLELDPPRLVVQYRNSTEGDLFEWGLVGQIPVLALIGRTKAVCAELAAGRRPPPCDVPGNPPGLVIAMDPRDGSMMHRAHPDIPADPLVGMLEVIAALLVAGRLAQQKAAAMSSVLGPDGQPMRTGGAPPVIVN